MDQSFGEEPSVKTEPVDLDFCQDDFSGSLGERGAFVGVGNSDIEQATDNDNTFVVPPKRKRGHSKKVTATKRTMNKKKVTAAGRKSDIGVNEDNREFIESTNSETSGSSHQSAMFEEPQDLLIKTDQDNPAHLSVDLPCPPSLQHYTDDEIRSAFEQCGGSTGKVIHKLKIADPASLFGQVYIILTNNKTSCLYERQYLHRLWLQMYKPESLKKFGDDQIGTAFLLCYNRQSKLNMNAPNGLYSKVYTFLTENKTSNWLERRYLFDLWTIRYKEALQLDRGILTKVQRKSRPKIHRRLQMQRKRELLLGQAMIPQTEEEHPLLSPEHETTFETEQDCQDDEILPSFPQVPAEQDKKQIRIRLKVEVEGDDEDYEASNAESNEDSSRVNDTSYEVPSPAPLPPREPQQKANDTDPKLILKPVVRLTRLSARKLPQGKNEGSTESKSQAEKTSTDKRRRKSVATKKYDEKSAEEDLSVDDDLSDDYRASEPDHNSSDDDPEFELNMSTAAPPKRTSTLSCSRDASARALKRARGRPRIHPQRERKPRPRNSIFEKLVNYRHWGVWKTHTDPDLPIPVDIWQESHGKHGDFMVSNISEVVKEDIEKITPTAGKGTFANPHWTKSDGGKRRRPLKCVCPACGLTFFEIDELLQHRDKTHREYISMCVICGKPVGKRINMAPHLATHCSKDELEEFFETEISTLGAPPKGSFYRLFKCQNCFSIFVGSKGFYKHKEQCIFKRENYKWKVTRRNPVSRKTKPISSDSSVKKFIPPGSSWTSSNCKVCGKSLNSEYMSLHLRTHFNFEEQKEYVRKRQNEMKNITVEKHIPGKYPTDMRIEQLKKILEALERKNGHVITEWTKPTLDKEASVIKKETCTVRRAPRRQRTNVPAQCSVCGQILSSIYVLRQHEMAKHGGGVEKNFECNICKRPFGKKDSLAFHTPTHFNLEEQEKYSVWTGRLWEFLERLNSGEDLNKPPKTTSTPTRTKKLVMRLRRVKKKKGRPRKHHHLYEDKDVYRIGGGEGGQGQSESIFSGAAAGVSAGILEDGGADGASALNSTLHWDAV